MTNRRSLVVLVAVLACVAPACGGGGGAKGDASVVGMLELVPDTGDYGDWVQIGLYDRAAKQAGIEKPAKDDKDALKQYILAITGVAKDPRVFAPLSEMVLRPAERFGDPTAVMGFDAADVSGDVTAGGAPDVLQALRGGFDEKRIDKALEGDEWPRLIETKDHNGIDYYRWLDDGEIDYDTANPLSPIGESVRLAVVDGVVCEARFDDAIESAIDARKGKVDSLADNETFAAAAKVLDDNQVHGAVFVGDRSLLEAVAMNPRVTPSEYSELLEESGGPLAPYELLAVGGTRVRDQSLMIVVLVNDDGGTAKENAARLETIAAEGTDVATGERFSERLKVRSVEAKGKLTMGIFEVENPAFYQQALMRGSSLFLHE